MRIVLSKTEDNIAGQEYICVQMHRWIKCISFTWDNIEKLWHNSWKYAQYFVCIIINIDE